VVPPFSLSEKWLGDSLPVIRLPWLLHPLVAGARSLMGSPAFMSCTPAFLAGALLL